MKHTHTHTLHDLVSDFSHFRSRISCASSFACSLLVSHASPSPVGVPPIPFLSLALEHQVFATFFLSASYVLLISIFAFWLFFDLRHNIFSSVFLIFHLFVYSFYFREGILSVAQCCSIFFWRVKYKMAFQSEHETCPRILSVFQPRCLHFATMLCKCTEALIVAF